MTLQDLDNYNSAQISLIIYELLRLFGIGIENKVVFYCFPPPEVFNSK